VSDSNVNLIVTAVDRATQTIDKVEQKLGGLDRTVKRIDNSVGTLRRGFNRLNAFLQGFGIGVGFSALMSIERVLGRIARALPDAIGRGEQWVATVRDISDVAGLAAERASVLAAAAQYVGLSQEEVINGFSRLRREGLSADQAFAAIAQRMGLTSDQLRLIEADARRSGLILSQSAIDAATRWEQTKNRLAATSIGVGAQILGGVAPALEALVDGIANAVQRNMDQIVRFAVQVVNFVAGLVGGFLGLDFSARTFASTLNSTGPSAQRYRDWLAGITGESPKAARGIDSVTTALERQMRAIDNRMRVLDRAERDRDAARQRRQLVEDIAEARSGDRTDAVTRAIERQIAAIDRQIDAIDERERKIDWDRRRSDLIADIEQARRELDDLRTKGVFTAGMTHAEAELARQKAAADIIEGETRLKEAKDRLAEALRQEEARRERDRLRAQREALQKQLRMHQEMLASQKRLADAIERLREHDHDQAVRRRREALEDQRRALQEQLAAQRRHLSQVRDDIGRFKPPPIQLPKIDSAALSKDLQAAAEEARRQGQKAADDMRIMLFGGSPKFGSIQGQERAGLFDKIDGLVTTISRMWNERLGPLTEALWKMTDPLWKLLGPEGIAGLILLWKFGGPLWTMLTAIIGRLGVPGGGGPIPVGGARGGIGAVTRAVAPIVTLSVAAPLIGESAESVRQRWQSDPGSFSQTDMFQARAPMWAVERRNAAAQEPTGGWGRVPKGARPGSVTTLAGRDEGTRGMPPNIDRSPEGEMSRRTLGQINSSLRPGSPMFQQWRDIEYGAQRGADAGEATSERLSTGIDANVTQKAGTSLSVENPAFSPMRVNTDRLLAIESNTGPLRNGRLGVDGTTSTGTLAVGGAALGGIETNTNPLRNGRLGVDGANSTGALAVSSTKLDNIDANTNPLRNGRIGVDGPGSTGSLAVSGTKLDNIESNTNPLRNGRLGIDGPNSVGSMPVGGPALSSIVTNTDPLRNGSLDLQGTSLTRLNSIWTATNNTDVKLSTTNANTAQTRDRIDTSNTYLSRINSNTTLIASRLFYIDPLAVHMYKLRQGFSKVYWPSTPRAGYGKWAFAQGGAGLTNGPMDAVMGEAGREAYAILRNPRRLPAGGYAAGSAGSGPGGGSGEMRVLQPLTLEVGRRVFAEAVLEVVVRNGKVSSTLRNN
jgi:hypothetical protein